MKKSLAAPLVFHRHRLRSITRWALVAFLATAAPAFAQTTVWTDGTGNWFNPANWSAGVPTSSTIAQINNAGTTQITSSGAAASLLELGVGAGDAGTLSISGAGTLQDEGAMYVGEGGAGTLSITAGATVSSSLFALGQSPGSSGTAMVSGVGSTWTNSVFCFGLITDGRVDASSGVAKERIDTVGYVAAAGGVVKKRVSPGGRVLEAGGVAKECERSIGCVLVTGGVA